MDSPDFWTLEGGSLGTSCWVSLSLFSPTGPAGTSVGASWDGDDWAAIDDDEAGVTGLMHESMQLEHTT